MNPALAGFFIGVSKHPSTKGRYLFREKAVESGHAYRIKFSGFLGDSPNWAKNMTYNNPIGTEETLENFVGCCRSARHTSAFYDGNTGDHKDTYSRRATHALKNRFSPPETLLT